MVDGINDIDKRMLKLKIAKLLNPKLIQDDPIFKFIQVHENEEDQSAS